MGYYPVGGELMSNRECSGLCEDCAKQIFIQPMQMCPECKTEKTNGIWKRCATCAKKQNKCSFCDKKLSEDILLTTMDSMKELCALAQRVAAASHDHSLLPEIRRECQRSLAGIDPESTARASADYRAGQAEMRLAVLTAVEQRTPQKSNNPNKPKRPFRRPNGRNK